MNSQKKLKCNHGINKKGECKKKPGPSRRRSKKPSRRRSKKPSRRRSKKPSRRRSKKPSRRRSKKPSRRRSKKPSRRRSKKPSRRRSKKPSRRRSKKPSRRRTIYMTANRCKEELKDKIKIIKREGIYTGKQAVAIAYSMIGKKYLKCKKFFTKRK